MSEATKERIKNETNPMVIATLLMSDEIGVEVSESTIELLKLPEEVDR